MAAFTSVLPGLGDHLGGHIDADDPPGLLYLLGGQEAVESPATAEVEDRLSRLQVGDSPGVPAAQPHVGAPGSASKLLL